MWVLSSTVILSSSVAYVDVVGAEPTYKTTAESLCKPIQTEIDVLGWWGNSKLGVRETLTVTLGGWGSGVASALVDDSGAMAGTADPGTGAESILQKVGAMGKFRVLQSRNPEFPVF